MKLTAAQRYYRAIFTEFRNDPEARYVANIILTACGKAGTKLANLLKLLRAGAEVRTAQFDMWVLLINGERYDYSALDTKEIWHGHLQPA